LNTTARLAAVAFATSAVAASLLTKATSASAFWNRSGPSICAPFAGGTVASSNHGCNDLTANSFIYYCPVEDNDSHPKTGITTLSLHIEEHNTVHGSAARCVKFWNSSATGGGACGASVATVSGNGATPISPATFASWDVGNFGYISIVLPSATASGHSCLKGLFTSG
jgi:hypothetical protein